MSAHVKTANKALIISAAATSLVAVFFLSLEFANADKIIRGASFAGTPLGGYSYDAARKHIQHRVEAALDSPLVITVFGEEERKTTLRKLGFSINTETEADRIFSLGRNANIFIGLGQQLLGLLSGIHLSAEPALDENIFETELQHVLSGLEQPPTDAAVVYDEEKQEFTITPEASGILVSRKDLHETARDDVARLTPDPIYVDRAPAQPKIYTAGAYEARDAANALRDIPPLTLAHEKKKWTADKKDVIDWIVFDSVRASEDNFKLTMRIDQSAIESFLLRNISYQINVESKNAELTIKDDRVTLFTPSQEGIELDTRASALEIASSIARAEKNVTLSVKIQPPDITTESINTLGIKELLASGESNFAGSPKNRTHNIKVGAEKFNGVLIKPGEEFSFNQILGDVNAETGYLPELVIKQNKTVPEYGGGLCQVATTAFRAAVFSGLEITKRYPHAYPVRYYGTPGFDATIYPPNPDLRFMNDTPGHILIQTRIVGTKLFFDFYGTSDGRDTEVIGPVVTKKGADGSAEAYLTMKVTRGEDTVREKTFYSKYRSPSLYPVERRNPLE